ncbi:MAG: MBL fold metallo-hydrolase [Deltaproteobacteria bacterium]|nr:MBL fold metallo-hydrolase [Deltaproteobacteria bacterium]
MKARITIICENSVSIKGGIGEHGFAAYLETERGNYLFDTGRGEGLIPNLLKFDKDPLSIQKIFLSHGHQDHTGGLASILELLGGVEVLAHPDLFSNRYHISRKDGKEIKRFVGLKFQRAYLESLGGRFILEKSFREVSREMYLTGEVPRKTPFEKGDANLFAESQGKLIPDPFLDDQSLIIDSPKGLVLVLGCAHAGMVNIIKHAMEKTGTDRVHAVIGGTHLDFASSPQVEETITALKEYKVEKVGVSHCTGLKAASRLFAEFGENFFFGRVGEVLEA